MSFNLNSILNLSEADAVQKIKNAGMKPRIRARNGTAFIVTADYRTDRVNIWIDGDVVVRATIG